MNTAPAPADNHLETAEQAGSRRLSELISQQPLFQGLAARHLPPLAAAAMEIQFEPGQPILEEGSPANRFYLILSGKVALEAEVPERGRVCLQVLGPGDDLGWSWLFPPYSLHFSARALEPTRTIFFYGTRLREACEQDHDLGYELLMRVTAVMVKRLEALQRQLLKGHV